MDNSLLVSLSQQLAAYRSMDVIANNLANVSTPGFKREAAKFEEYVTQVAPAEGQTGTQTVSFVQGCRHRCAISARAISRTPARRSISRINGKGYFAVQTPHGMRYTRDGHFTLDANGQIVDQRRLCGAGRWRRHHHHPQRRRHPHRHRRHRLQRRQRHRQPDRQAARSSISPTTRALTKEGANLYSTTQTPTTPTSATMQPGHAGSLQRPAGDRDQPHDRSDARLSGDRDPEPSPRKI